jgi:hypothetical protein
MRIDLTKPANYIAIQYKGANYMCVEDSERARILKEANVAWRMGYDALERELFSKACAAPGCAFEHRDAQGGADHG